jgi:hypothetical protein
MNSTLWKARFFFMRRYGKVMFAIGLLATIAWGCSKPEGPPPAVSLEQLPAALQKAFVKAKPEATEPLNALLAALGEKDYPKALTALQGLSAVPGLNKAQANLTAAGLVTLNNALQDAQTSGDQNAAQALQTYRATK